MHGQRRLLGPRACVLCGGAVGAVC